MILRPGQVAAITGAGSGIGRALALACAGRGLALSLSDVDPDRLAATAELAAEAGGARGARVTTRRVDVTDREAVRDWAATTVADHGACHLLFNNAGVLMLGAVDEATDRDWEWVLGINLRGVIHGVDAFLPHLLERSGEAHVVNTASLRGIVPTLASATYCTSKFAVLGLSESLALDLRERGVGVTVICPWAVRTELMDHQERRPEGVSRISEAYVAQLTEATRTAEVDLWMAPETVAALTLEGIETDELYVITHPLCRPLLEQRHQGMLDALDRLAARHPELPRATAPDDGG